MKKVFLTGANGFIGKNLKEQLQDKYHLLTPGRSGLNLLDERQVSHFFKKNDVDIVIHAAVVGGSRKEQQVTSALSDNLRIFLNIIKNRDRFKKMIHLGSGAEYDKSKPLVKVKETDFGKAIPQDDYGFFKYLTSKIGEDLHNVVHLRIFGVFGKYEDYRLRFISYAIWRNLQGLPIVMNQNVYFDYLYIDDFVKIIDYFIGHKAKHKFYNIGTGVKIDLITLANIVNKIAEKKSKIIVKKKELNNEYTCDNTRLITAIPHLHFIDINKAISDLYQWYKNHKEGL